MVRPRTCLIAYVIVAMALGVLLHTQNLRLRALEAGVANTQADIVFVLSGNLQGLQDSLQRWSRDLEPGSYQQWFADAYVWFRAAHYCQPLIGRESQVLPGVLGAVGFGLETIRERLSTAEDQRAAVLALRDVMAVILDELSSLEDGIHSIQNHSNFTKQSRLLWRAMDGSLRSRLTALESWPTFGRWVFWPPQ